MHVSYRQKVSEICWISIFFSPFQLVMFAAMVQDLRQYKETFKRKPSRFKEKQKPTFDVCRSPEK